MKTLSENTAAQWWAGHPALLALCLCLMGLATVTAAWWISLISTSTAEVVGFLDVACLYVFLMQYFGIDQFIRMVKGIWSCLAGIWGLFNS